jgi:hypothetical protein
VLRIIREILRLVWKLLRLLVWKWLQPLLTRLLLIGFALVTLVLVIVLIAR